MSSKRLVAVVVSLAVCAACGRGGPARSDVASEQSPKLNLPPALETQRATTGSAPRIVFLGDSLTAGLGISVDEAYPAVVQRRLKEAGLNYDVVNAGVSGDTSAGGLARLDWSFEGDVRVLVLALGANDGLRGLPVSELKQNLSTIIERAQARGITVVLAGMEAPTNFGVEYQTAFHKVYPELANKYRLQLVPFLLTGVAAVETLNQRDGIHPNPAGAKIVADNVLAVLRPTLEGLRSRD